MMTVGKGLLAGCLCACSYTLFEHRSRLSFLRNVYSQRQTRGLTPPSPPGVWSLLGRGLKLAVVFLPAVLLSWMLLVPFLRRLWVRLLLAAVQRAGPLFIKLGQYLSHRRDLVG
jgi:hypothetical protein